MKELSGALETLFLGATLVALLYIIASCVVKMG